jgi:broad specificity phosphatase PhoE
MSSQHRIRVSGNTLTKEEQRELLQSILPAAPPQEGTPQNTFTERELEELKRSIPSIEIVSPVKEENQHRRRNTVDIMGSWEPPTNYELVAPPPQDSSMEAQQHRRRKTVDIMGLWETPTNYEVVAPPPQDGSMEAQPQDGCSSETLEQHIWLIRYGETSPGLIENIGNYDSDLHMDGVEHAKAIARNIALSGHLPEHVFSDPFLRCMHTADTIAAAFNQQTNGSLKVKVEEGTTEWQVPSLLVDPEGVRTNPRTLEELLEIFDNADEYYQSLNPQGPDRDSSAEEAPEGCPRFPESEAQLHERCETTIDRILNHVGDDSIAIVSHAPCLQHTALALDGSPTPEDSKLGGWSLGGVTHFSRRVGETKWTLKSYSDTSHMPGKYKDGELGKWSLPSFVRV